MARPKNSDAGQTRQRILTFVRRRLHEGLPPTVREVQRAFKFRAVQSAQAHLAALVEEGHLHQDEGRARGYRLPERQGGGAPSFLVPLVGRVQAGALTTADEDLEGYVPVEVRRGLGKDARELFALRVRGDSMMGAGILAGDVVIVRRQQTAHTGDVVVALVNNEATVKRLRLSRGRVELLPENPAFSPIVIESRDDLLLLGRVLEVRRYLDGFRA